MLGLVAVALLPLSPMICAGATVAQASAIPVVLLDGHAAQLDGHPYLVTPRGATPPAPSAFGAMALSQTGTLLPTTEANEAWMLIRMQARTGAERTWALEFPSPGIDDLAVFEWQGASLAPPRVAGDRILMRHWSQPDRFPSFGIKLRPGEARDYVIRVRNAVPISVPIRILPTWMATNGDASENLVEGLAAGALALLALSGLMQTILYRHAAFLYFSVAATFAALTVVSFSGAAGRFLWGDLEGWNNGAKAFTVICAAAAYVMLVRRICNVPVRSKALSAISAGVCVFAVCVALLNGVTGGDWPRLGAAGVSAASLTLAVIAVTAWLRGDRTGMWVLVAHIPVAVLAMRVALRSFGVLEINFDLTQATSLALGFETVIFLVLVHARTKDLISLQSRAHTMERLDALTGQLNLDAFLENLRKTVSVAPRRSQDAGVLYIRVANLVAQPEGEATVTAENTMIRAVLRIHRAIPNFRWSGRIDANTIALIIASDGTREALQDRASRLVAHGLMAAAGSAPGVPFRFLVAARVLSRGEAAQGADKVHGRMLATLDKMSPRTRRPIRFVDDGEQPMAVSPAPSPDLAGRG